MTLRFIHCADLHIDSPLLGLERYEGAPVHEMRDATRRAFVNIVDLAFARDVDFVVIAGDVFDGDWQDFNTGLFFANQMRRLGDAGIAAYVVRGNHDAQSRITRSLPPLANVRVFGSAAPETFIDDELGLAVHGQSFASADVRQDLAAGYPVPRAGLFNIGVLHTALTGREGHAPYAPTTGQRLADQGYDYWALGHVHAREVVRRDPWVVFPGCAQGRHARETGAKGCMVVEAEPGRGVLSAEFVATDVARWVRLTVDAAACASIDDLHDAIQQQARAAVQGADGRPLALRLRIDGRTPLHARLTAHHDAMRAEVCALVNEASRGVAWLEKIELSVAAPLDLAALARRDDPVGALVRFLDAIGEDAQGQQALARVVLAEMSQRIPAELRVADEGVDFDSPSTLKGVFAAARERLLAAIPPEDR
ncbi:MAG: DNA repair exonuclease [Casimicrobiaceae bacterium]